jgi:hypothetical protein
MLDQGTLGDVEPKFKDMQNIVHIDEKWYFMTKMEGNTTWCLKKMTLYA